MARRLAEYFVAVGVRKSRLEKEGHADGSFPEVKGVVLQRFPTEDRKEAPLPGGFEIFCQPMGWHLTTTPEPPYYINFILTAEDSSRLFCSALNFHQLHKPAPKTIRRHVALSMHGKVPTEKNRPHSRYVDYFLDEENEAHWTPDAVVVQQEDIYEPHSLALVSKFPLFETLQACLKAIYVTWLSSGQPSGHAIEPLVANLLSSVTVPLVNCPPVRRPLGLLKELIVHPIDEASSLPYSSTCTIALLKSIGVHNLMSILAAVLSDISILIISSSYTALTFTVQAIWSLLFPLKVTHSLVPVVPAALLDYVQLPSTYIMGVHSSLKANIGELPDVVVVDLDDGHMSVPSTVVLQHLPDQLKVAVEDALAEVLHPSIKQRDYVFMQDFQEVRSLEIQDREVRAIFLCLFVHVLADYQDYITVIRFHPHPAFAFRKDNFLAKHASGEIQNLIHKITDSIAFINFTHERSVPYRKCDFFDELVVRYMTTIHSWSLGELFSRTHIQQLAQEIMKLLPVVQYGSEAFNLSVLNKEHIDIPPRRFPVLSYDLMDSDSSTGTLKANPSSEEVTNCRTIPLLDSNLAREFQKQPSAVVKELEMLRNCLDAIFRGTVLEARKYLPSVIAALGNRSISTAMYPELVCRILKFGALVSSEQYDMIAKIMNSALNDREVATVLLPLVIILYREVKPGVQQELSTSVQNHYIWSELDFWKNAFSVAVQAELVRVYAELEVAKLEKASAENAKGTDVVEADEPDTYTQRSRERLKSASARGIQPSTKTLLVLSRSAKMRMKASVPIPNLSEGILPPEAQPVTTEEALHHLAKRLKMWPGLTEEERTMIAQQEENAIQNQLVLFINRIIALRTPLEVAAGEEDQHSLEEFIGKFLKAVESNLCFEFSKYGKIKDLISVSIESYSRAMNDLRNDLKKQPIMKPKMAKPPILQGETFRDEGIHCYLMQDGRDSDLLLPAEGHFFVTTYRVIFMGIPCSPQAPNVIITRSAPVCSIFRLKKLPPVQLNSLGYMTTGGVQLRTLTAELIKLGFGEDMSPSDQQKVFDKLIEYRQRGTIILGLAYPQESAAQVAVSESMAVDFIPAKPPRVSQSHLTDARNRIETTTRVKLCSALAQSPCCQEYKRTTLGSLSVNTKKGPWRLSDVNMQYDFCTSYPAVIAVPNEITDEHLPTVSAQFLCKRLPVATWKHPTGNAVLLRSASFQNAAPKKQSGSNIALGGSSASPGITHPVVQNYLNSILNITRATVDDKKYNTLQNLVSVLPETVEFESGDVSTGDTPCQDSAQTTTGYFKSYLPKPVSESNPDNCPSGKVKKLTSGTSDSEIQLNDIVIEGHDGPGSPRAIDWEAMGSNQPSTSPTPTIPEEADTPELLSPTTGRPDELSLNWQFIPGNEKEKQMKKLPSSSSLTFSSIPTQPRDWVVMHALPKELKQWSASALYVIGNRSALHDVPPDIYPNCTLVPVDVHTLTEVKESFRKLLHCCAPTTNQSGYFSGIDDSKWLSQICTIMELAGAVTDLIDTQGSSVLVCLEDGWDITAQVVALAQILLDPHYRTLEGFKALVEKDWLSFGHKFSERGQHKVTLANVTPVFLQFLDAVHQVLRQFPLSFEFNDFYLRTMAYHHCSMRFHTFCLDSERERYDNNWLKYRARPNTHADTQSFVSYWDYIDEIHSKSTIFYNFKYQPPDAGVPQTPLRPYSFQANLDVWSVYLYNHLSQFPPYDIELICENDLTMVDLHRQFLNPGQQSLPLAVVHADPFDPATREVSVLMKQFTSLMNMLTNKQNGSETTWLHIIKGMYKTTLQPLRLSTSDLQAEHFRQAMHKRTSLAVLIKGKIASELLGEAHEFMSCTINSQDSCNFCNLHILRSEGASFQCRRCGCICHSHCKLYMPINCAPRDGVRPDKALKAVLSSALHSGQLYKKGKIVRSWKQRKFVLDPMKGELSYLEDDRTQGSILIKDITSVEEAEPQPVNGLTKQGFFFNVCTPKRVFNLMAQSEDERKGWLEKIRVALNS